MSKVSGALTEGGRGLRPRGAHLPGVVPDGVRDPRSLTDGRRRCSRSPCCSATRSSTRSTARVQRSSSRRCRTTSTWTSTRSPALASVSIVAGILLSLPVSLWSDRSGRRTWFLAGGALVAALFSLTAGIATTIGLFGLSRAGFGFGLIVNDPVQQSLLSDYTPVAARPSVFAGPPDGRQPRPAARTARVRPPGPRPRLAGAAVRRRRGSRWSSAFASLRLREPAKGGMERAAMGVTGADLEVEEDTGRLPRVVADPQGHPHGADAVVLAARSSSAGCSASSCCIPLFLDEVYGMSARRAGHRVRRCMGIPAHLRAVRRHRAVQALPVLRRAVADVPADGRHRRRHHGLCVRAGWPSCRSSRCARRASRCCSCCPRSSCRRSGRCSRS